VSSVCDLEASQPPELSGHDAAAGTCATKRYPTKREVLAVIPQACFDRSLLRSSLSLVLSLALTLGSGALAYAFIPLTWSWQGSCSGGRRTW
jgi:hypothetical protein